MKVLQALAVSFALTGCHAGPTASPPSLCDKYTTALLKENSAKNQQTLLTLVVNTAVIGNYTKPNVGIAVPGILAPGTGKFAGVNLSKYFAGMLKSTNPEAIGMMGRKPIAVNWLDGGGAEPLKKNMPGNDSKSNQYVLLSHLYSYFAALLGCSKFGKTTMPYMSELSMYKVHKFMALDEKEVSYFITQVGLSAASFGVTKEDVATVGKALMDTFGYRCSPPASVPMTAKANLQSICIESTCPCKSDAMCGLYDPVMEPMM